MRKIRVALISLAVVALGFWGYVTLMDTAPIQVPHGHDTQDLDVPRAAVAPQPIGDTTLEAVKGAKYFKYDPVTRQIAAEYGFQQLLNPGQGSSRWQVEKPYLIFYGTDYQCRVDSERGTFQVETVGSQSIYKDAQLDKNVVIHITPRPESRIDEINIRMDDLTFSSERSEFATDGPVTIESSQIRMEGYGLIVIFNAGVGKIEYLQIKDLDFLRLKGFASVDSPLKSKSAETAPAKKTPPPIQPGEGVTEGGQPAQQAAVLEPSVPQAKEATVNSSDYYQCAIRDNVVIQYGNELIVSGADQVNIQNILFSNMNETVSGEGADKKKANGEAKTAAASLPGTGSIASQPETAQSQTAVNANDSQDIMVWCDGGMIIQPMQNITGGRGDVPDSDLAFEMSGAPLKINRILDDAAANGSETLAHCGELTYKPAEDVLRLFTNAIQPRILLNTGESNSRIETSGNVFWDRKAQRANIAGPGKVYIGNVKNPAALPSEISFNGMMDLLFARMPDNISSATIQTINLTGGMDAILRQNGTLKTLADSAVLEFGPANQLSEARLDGDVHFESLEKGKSSSKAASRSAVFYFTNNQIAAADLNGAVHFASASGQMDSANAKIEFEPDASGSMHPKVIRTEGDAVLQTVSTVAAQPPAKFEAKRIDYDLQTGSGLAYGPIRFTYFQNPDSADASVKTWIPLTITADKDARFVAGPNRDIQQIVFNENVIAMRLFETLLYTRRDEFHGDKLIVDINKNDVGGTDISKITFKGGKVFGQSIKMHGEEVLFNVRLTCKEMAASDQLNEILVTGPGEMQLNNSKADVTSSGTGINFQRPCYALIRGFDTIHWSIKDQKMIADGDEKTMDFAYVPLVGGKEEKYIYVDSRQIEASYLMGSDGKPSIQRVFSDKVVTYTEQEPITKKNVYMLAGQTLDYDAASDVGWLTITGSETNPCFANGVRVPAIRYNVNSGKLETSLSTRPGVLGIPK